MKQRSFVVPFVLMSLIVAGGNYCVATLLSLHGPAWLRDAQWYAISWLCFFLLQMSAPLLQMNSRKRGHINYVLDHLQWIAYAALGVASTMLFLAFSFEVIAWMTLLILGDGYSGLIDQLWFRAMVSLSIVLAVGGMIQALVGPRIVQVMIPVANLPQALHGFRIVQISDLHVSDLIGYGYAKNVVDMANRLNADIVALTGDFIDGTVENLRDRIAPLKDLQSRYGRFFVTGNHEYYYNGEAWAHEHALMGARVLLNEHEVLNIGDARLAIVGVTDSSAGHFVAGHLQDLKKAVADVPQDAFKILLAHQPGCYAAAEAAGMHLQLSGHTHGGQFFPWQFAVRLVHRYARGLALHGRMWIYVNPGTGFWGPPLRSLVPSEITVLVLQSQES